MKYWVTLTDCLLSVERVDLSLWLHNIKDCNYRKKDANKSQSPGLLANRTKSLVIVGRSAPVETLNPTVRILTVYTFNTDQGSWQQLLPFFQACRLKRALSLGRPSILLLMKLLHSDYLSESRQVSGRWPDLDLFCFRSTVIALCSSCKKCDTAVFITVTT